MALLLVVELLHCLAETFRDIHGARDESSPKNNSLTDRQVLQDKLARERRVLLNRMPLRQRVEPPSMMDRLQAMVTEKSTVRDICSTARFRPCFSAKCSVKNPKNNIFVDIIEDVGAIVDRDKQVASGEVTGIVHGISCLSTSPT